MSKRVLRGVAIFLVAFPEPITTMLGVALLFATYAQFGKPKADSAERLEALLQNWAHYHKPIGYIRLTPGLAPGKVVGGSHRPYRRMASMEPIKLGVDIGDERSHAFQRDYLAWCRQTRRVPLAQHVAYYGAIARAMNKSLPRRVTGVREAHKETGNVQGHGVHRRVSGPGSSTPVASAGSRLRREVAVMRAGDTIPVKLPWGAETRGLVRSSR